MQKEIVISGQSKEEIQQQLRRIYAENSDLLNLSLVIDFNATKIYVEIDIDLGGGFESGYETTTLSAAINANPLFRFAINKEHFIDEIGKFFGMEDIELGYPEFDRKLIVKTNDATKLHDVLADTTARTAFEELEDFTFGITTHRPETSENKIACLELTIETGITEADKLFAIYEAFYTVLIAINKV
jgi:hypothetical protein